MSKRNERYLRPEQLNGTRAEGRAPSGQKNKGESGVSGTMYGRFHGGFQGVKGRELTVNVKPPEVNMPKKSRKTKLTQRFPTLKRGTKKERLTYIKNRVLALKFGYIWERKTFGHVTPFRARQYYEKRLLQKSVRQWEDIWWNGRNEWKLNIRADYHNRFRLWLKIWRAWRSFITAKRVKKTKLNLARTKANYAQLARYVAYWTRYITGRRAKKQFYLKAKEQGRVLTKRRTFNRWKNYLAFKRELLSMEEQALHFWARNLFCKAWRYWILNYNISQEEKYKFVIAVQFYNRRLAFNVFGSLKLYRIQRKVKELRFRSSERYHRLQSLRRWYSKWKGTWTRKRELAQFEDAIQGKGEKAKKRRILLTWKSCILFGTGTSRVHIVRQGLGKVVSIDAMKCILVSPGIGWHFEECFNSLDLITSVFTDHLRSLRQLCMIKLSVEVHRLHKNDNNVFELAFPLSLLTLSKDINLCRRQWQNQVNAWNHYKKTLKVRNLYFYDKAVRKCLKALQKRVSDRNLKNSRILEALSFYKFSLTRRMWNAWLTKCETCEELRLMTLNNFVKKHYRKVLLKRMMKEWRLYGELKKQKKADNEKADEMARKNLLPRCFGRWQAFVEIVKERRRSQEKAEEFRRECLLAKTYYYWWRLYQQALDGQMLYRVAVVSYDEKIKRQFLKIWLAKARWKLRENSLLARGEIHYERQLKKKYFSKWIEFRKYVNCSLKKLEMAVRHQNTKLLTTSWGRWTKFICKKRIKWKLVAIADLSFHHRILKKTLTAWRVYSNRMKKVNSYAEERKHEHEKITVRMLFRRWRKNARYLTELKEGVYKAFQHWKFKAERKVFVAWRIIAAEHFWRKQESLLKTTAAQKTLERVKLRRYFQAWRRIYSQKVIANNLLARAVEHWKRQTLRKSLDTWLKFRFLGYRKLVLQQQCMWYHNCRIITSSLKIWKMNYQERANLTKKSHVALWMWSFTLQRKVFAAWFQYAKDKKRRKRAVSEALERRRRWLYTWGVTQWIKFATHSIAEREKIATGRHIRLSENIQRSVQRCALHWRRKTERNLFKRSQITCSAMSSVRSAKMFNSRPINKVKIEKQSSQNVKKIDQVIPQGAKRPKPRRPEYLRESFSFSEVSEIQSGVPMQSIDDIEALPRQWRSDLRPATPPPRLQKPTNFTPNQVTPQSGTSEKSLQKQHGLLANVASRDNHVLLPPSCFVSCNDSVKNKHENRPGMMRGIRNDSKSNNKDSLDRDTMPSFLCDRDSQQSIVQLRNRMLKYYSVSMELRNMRQRLQHLREWSREPREEEEKLSEEELVLVHEIIEKLSGDVNIMSRNLDASYGTIANDLQQFLDKIT